MIQEAEQKIKNIWDEILRLKTASKYSSIRSSHFNSSTTVRTGLYRITYQTTGEPIMSKCFIDTTNLSWQSAYYMRIFPRTPSANTQIIEVNTSVDTSDHQSYITYDVKLIVLSNRSVVSITRIS